MKLTSVFVIAALLGNVQNVQLNNKGHSRSKQNTGNLPPTTLPQSASPATGVADNLKLS